jgi:uncharacterized protein (TIGR02246 family)
MSGIRVSYLGRSASADMFQGRIVPNSEKAFPVWATSLKGSLGLYWGLAKARTCEMSTTTEAITALLAKYNEALNASSTEAVMPLYAEDGVFMPPYSQSAVGAEAVRKAYAAVFNAITLNVRFTIAEIVELGAGWAFARTNSAGTTTDHATGNKSAEGNQELFIFRQNHNGAWKIARYSFSPTNPPRR